MKQGFKFGEARVSLATGPNFAPKPRDHFQVIATTPAPESQAIGQPIIGDEADGHLEHLPVLLAVGDVINQRSIKDAEHLGFDNVLAETGWHTRQGGKVQAFEAPLPEKTAALPNLLVILDPFLQIRAELHGLDLSHNGRKFSGEKD